MLTHHGRRASFAVALAAASVVAGVVAPRSARPQNAPPSRAAEPLRGVVRAPDGRALDAANVFILETLEGMATQDDGRFVIATAEPGAVTLVVRRLGYAELRRTIAPSERSDIVVTLQPGAVRLAPVAVQAGRYTAGEERGATLTPLEVVTTPGTAADVNRAIQSLPGVQAGDEGTALFVRGGDFTETRVFLNDAALLTPVQLQTPTGTFTGTVDPFLLDGIFFSSGGFGARYGDALSGVAALRTQGRPARSSATAGAGLATISGSLGARLTPTLALRAAANRSNLEPMFRLNGSRQRYDPPPHGRDLSASAIWSYRPTGELKVFAIEQTNALTIGVEEASYAGDFDFDASGRQVVASWRDIVGRVAPTVTLAASRVQRGNDFGAFRLATVQRHAQLFAQGEWETTGSLTLRGGGELDRLTSSYDGSIPDVGHDVKPEARTTVIASRRTSERTGAFAEADWRPKARVRLVGGVRTDRSTLAGERTVDPRLSVAVTTLAGITLTGAWGIYHQVPDPLYYDDSLSTGHSGAAGESRRAPLGAMRAEQRILGAQLGSGERMARVEVYEKRYDDLAQRTRDYDVVVGGTGEARGIDVFAKGRAPLGMGGRVTYSYVSSRRTDPDAGIVTRAPYDVTYSLTTVAERALAGGWRISAAYRYATGRPVTPVLGATFDPEAAVYVPTYGAPLSDRLPAFQRVDLSASYFRQMTPALQGVFFLSVMNVLDRVNAQRYRYTTDYTRRSAVPSIFERSVYFGATITWLKENR